MIIMEHSASTLFAYHVTRQSRDFNNFLIFHSWVHAAIEMKGLDYNVYGRRLRQESTAHAIDEKKHVLRFFS